MKHEELIRQADDSFETGMALFNRCDFPAAREAFRIAYQIYRKNGNGAGKIFDAAFYLAVCIIQTYKSKEELLEAEDLLLRFVRDNDTIDGIPRQCFLAKTYSALGKFKLMRIVCKDIIGTASTDGERVCALAGAAYAAGTDRTASDYAQEAIPLLKAEKEHSIASAIVLEALARSVENISAAERMGFANELLNCVKDLGKHPILPSEAEVYMLLSCICTSTADWDTALQFAIMALNTASCVEGTSNKELAFIYRMISNLYDMKGENKLCTSANFEALKLEATFSPDLYASAEAFQKLSEQLSCWGEYRMAASALTYALRCYMDSEEYDSSQIRDGIILLQKYDRMY